MLSKFLCLIFIFFSALVAFTSAQFDEQELPALKSIREKLPEQWVHSPFIEQTKTILDSLVNRLDWKLQDMEEKIAPYYQAIDQKQTALQQAAQRGVTQNVQQQLYDDLLKEQQKWAPQIQQIGASAQVTAAQKKMVEDLQFYTQGLESCELRRSLLICRDANGGSLTQQDLREERRSLNTILEWTSSEEEPQLEDVTSTETLTSAQVLEAARKLCQRRAEIVYNEVEKVIQQNEELVQRSQEAAAQREQQQGGASSRFRA